jgi:hypothetical protein
MPALLLCGRAAALSAERDQRDQRDAPHPPYLDAKAQRTGESNLNAPAAVTWVREAFSTPM